MRAALAELAGSLARGRSTAGDMIEPYAAIAEDFVGLYAATTFPIEGQDDFERQWTARRLETMHYAGVSLPRTDYRPEVTSALLTVASAYLTLPLSVSFDAIEFGLWLCFYVFSTQPALAETPPTGAVVHRIPATPATMETVRDALGEASPLPRIARGVAQRLQRAGAFDLTAVVPTHGVALRELVKAHQAAGKPLVDAAAAQAVSSSRSELDSKRAVADALDDYARLRDGLL